MGNLSIILPAYKEPFLNRTIESILCQTWDDTEIIVVLDGYKPTDPVLNTDRVTVIELEENRGHRNAINTGIKASHGKYIMKLDAHCVLCDNFDKIILNKIRKNWLVVPRRYGVNHETWQAKLDGKYWDYHFMSFPTYAKYGLYMGPGPYKYKNPDVLIDDTMLLQGSCWVANKEYFMENIFPLDDSEETYGSWCGDHVEIGLKYWLGGGEIKVNKKAWYGHLAKTPSQYKKGMFSRDYKRNETIKKHNKWVVKHWMDGEEPGMKPISWLIKKFWPIPTWPDNWEEEWASLKEQYYERNTVM